MHFIDYLPWPVYVLILIFSAIVLFWYIITYKKFNLQERIGCSIIIIGGVGLIVDKIVEATSYNIQFSRFSDFIVITPVATIIGFIIFGGGIIRRTKDPEQKRKLKIYYTFLCVAFGLVGILFLVF